MNRPTLFDRLTQLEEYGIEVLAHETKTELSLGKHDSLNIAGILVNQSGKEILETIASFERYSTYNEFTSTRERLLYGLTNNCDLKNRSYPTFSSLNDDVNELAKKLDIARGGDGSMFEDFIIHDSFETNPGLGIDPHKVKEHRIYDSSTRIAYSFILPSEEMALN